MPSAVPTVARSAVKSVNTDSVVPTVATATMSASAIFSATYFCADSTARCTSSGCIELVSNTSVIRRRPASASEVIADGAAGAGAAAGLAAEVSSFSLASTPASRSAVRTADAGPWAISSKLKLWICWTRPSSFTSKSAAVRSRTIAPDLSRTITSTEITSRLVRNTARGCAGCCAAGIPSASTAARTTQGRARLSTS